MRRSSEPSSRRRPSSASVARRLRCPAQKSSHAEPPALASASTGSAIAVIASESAVCPIGFRACAAAPTYSPAQMRMIARSGRSRTRTTSID